MDRLGTLELFVRIVDRGSFTAAAADCGVSRPVATAAIKALEERLGTRLLQRTTRQISLTEAGQGFYERIVGVLAGIEEAEAFVSGRSGAARGTLRVSAPTSFGRMHIAPHLKSFMDAHPELTLNIVLTDEFSDIVGGGFDLAIRIGELSDSSLVARRLAAVRRVLCATPGYLEKHGTPGTLDDLATHVCLPQHTQDVWRLEGPEGGVVHKPTGPLVTNSSEVIREVVLCGMGIALRSTWDVGAELKDGRLVQVLPGYEGSRNVVLSAVYPSRQFLPVKVRLFIDYLAELYGPLPYWER